MQRVLFPIYSALTIQFFFCSYQGLLAAFSRLFYRIRIPIQTQNHFTIVIIFAIIQRIQGQCIEKYRQSLRIVESMASTSSVGRLHCNWPTNSDVDDESIR